MENQKKMKTLVRCTTTGNNIVCTPESSAPVAKRRKAQSVADKDSSSDSDAPKAKRRRRFCNEKDVSHRPAVIQYRRRDRRKDALDFCRGFDLVSVLRYHTVGARLMKQQAKSAFGIPWLAVSGTSSISVVARSEDVLRLQQDHEKVDCFLPDFWETIISEAEGLPGKGWKILDYGLIQRQFGVVSVIKQDSNKKVHKASSDEYDVEKAIKFLQENMKTGVAFTTYMTTKTAISAFQRLFGKEFEDHEIRVFVFEYIGNSGKELKQRRKVLDIEGFLANINKARD